jgi:hypothetical protein
MKGQLFKKKLICIFLFSIPVSGLFANAVIKNTFPIVYVGKVAPVCIDKMESPVVHKAVGLFRNDVKEITDQYPAILNKTGAKGPEIVAGTLGESKLLAKIIKKHKLNTDSVLGRWEAFSVQIVNRREGNLLVVMGSDRRGTAYGIMEISRMIGISPWIWWADVKPERKNELFVELTKPVTQKPSVQYRGIFLNDEDWGLKPWASKTVEPETGEIGPKTYCKIFELMLRLRANTIWPAMHECTTPFYYVKGNAALADSFGIIISTSHCEPMMRSNPLEWDKKKRGAYNFFNNKNNVTEYWSERLTEVSGYENIYTVGMRGIHDGAMEGAKTISQQVDGLTEVFSIQRDLLSNKLKKNAEEIPQIFIPYKEVLDAYNAGLKVPEDVTLVWCDDNYGYLTRLSNEAERRRKGGSGVYYHISYWGRPHDYLWLGTTQPAFIWQEMQKAWSYDARKLWILNVGDIKPAEYLTEFFLDMAWDIDAIKPDGVSQHLESWLGNTFGNQHAASLKSIMDEYYRLAFIRKPEYMGWSQTEPTTKVKSTDLNFAEFGDEIASRLMQYDRIDKQVDSLSKLIPASLKSAYFELVKYPVSGAADMNRKWLNKQYADLFAPFNLNETKLVAEKSLKAWESIQRMTAYYNDSIENGKWKHMMSSQPRKLPVFDKPVLPRINQGQDNSTVFWAEESDKPMLPGDTTYLVIDNCEKGIYYFNNDSFKIISKPEWISVERMTMNENAELPANKLQIKMLPGKMMRKIEEGLLSFSTTGKTYYIKVKGISDSASNQIDNCIRLNASAFTRNSAKDFAHWQSVETLGYSGSAMLLQPFDAKLKLDFTENPSLEYEFSVAQSDSAMIYIYMLPTHPADSKNSLRIAVSVDGGSPVLFDIKTNGRSAIWKENKLRNQAIVKMPWRIGSPGNHTLRIYAVDPDVIIDQLMIDFKMERQFYGVGQN